MENNPITVREIDHLVLRVRDVAGMVRFYGEDELAVAFWRQMLAELPLGSRQVWPEDDPELISYLINPPLH